MTEKANILGILDKVDSPAITVRQSRCAVVRNRNVDCLKCADACTSGCISYEDGALNINLEKCVGCGTCATVCPTCALEAHNPGDAQLMLDCRAAMNDGTATIMCRPCVDALEGLIDETKVATVVCLGRVDESLAVGLVAEGASSVDLVCGNCDQCEQRHGLDTAKLVGETSNSLLASWSSNAHVSVRRVVPDSCLLRGAVLNEAHDKMDAYFSTMRGNDPVVGAAAVAQEQAEEDTVKVLKVMKDGTLPHFLPDRREKLITALTRIGEPCHKDIDTRLWGTVVIDGTKCTSCRMCATFCPTGAISKFDDEDGTMGVEHFPADCVKCGSCRDICAEDAIILNDTVNADFLINGSVHRYKMTPREVQLNNAHQILETMRSQTEGDIFER